MATVELKEIATDITWGDATRDINENNRKIQVALATVAAAGEGNAAWGESTTESAELIIGGSGTKVVSLDGHTHETSEVNGLDAKLAQTDASIDSLKSSDTAIKGQISGVNASISDLYNKVQDVDEGGVKKTDLKTLTVNVNGTKVGEYDTKADKTINITADMLGLSGAMAFVGVTITAISQGSTQNAIDLDDSTTYTAKTGDVVIYGKREFVWTGEHWQELGDEQSFALKSVTVTGTGYLTGGGTLEANRTIDIATSVKTKIDNGDAALTKANALETNLANNYPTKNGTGASGTWGIDISGKAASADKVANTLTFNSSGAGATSGSSFDGSAAKTISYNTIGAAKAVHSHAFSDITGKPTTLAGYGITDGASNAELSAHASNTDIHLAAGDRENIEAALVMASDVNSELTVILEGYDTTPTLLTELGKKANVGDLTAHTGNTTVHITASERSSWNAKYSKPATGIPVDDMEAGVAESLANADLALADVDALGQNFINHEGDTTVHITASERKAWNAKANASTLNSHTSNTAIHTTAEEKASWNGKYTKPTTGIPASDLDESVQADINSGAMSYEMASEASGKVSALLGSYGAEIPDLKTELGKKQDKLVSGTSIKTINGESMLGSGNITIPKTYTETETSEVVTLATEYSPTETAYTNVSAATHTHSDYVKTSDITNSLTSTEQNKPLSANMGKVLNERITNGDFSAKEAKMQWGGKNNDANNISPIEALLIEKYSRLTFASGDGCTVEYSVDNGTTWQAYTRTSDYSNFFKPQSSAPYYLGGSPEQGKATTDMLRVTLNAKGLGVYLGNVRKIYFYGQSTTGRINVTLERRVAVAGVSGGGDNAFEQIGTLTFSGWPGWGFLSVDDSYFGTWASSETYNYGSVIEYRLTFSIEKINSTAYESPCVIRLGMYSTDVYEANEYSIKYGSPLQLMTDGYLYCDHSFWLTKQLFSIGGIHTYGNTIIDGGLTINTSPIINGILTCKDNIQGTGTLTIDGDATLKSNATVIGDLTVNGTLNYTKTRVETSEASVTLDASKYTVINCGSELTINLPSGYATDGKEYVCEIRTGSIGPTVSFPSDIKFAFGDNFVSGFQPNSVYQISIQNSLAVVIPFV